MNAATAPSPKPPGSVVGGYTLLEEVGRGGMGSVYKATAPDGSTVAVKLLASHLNTNPVLLKRFQQEARLAKRISHPSLVRAIELGEHAGEHFFAMEFVEGESVGARVRRDRRFDEKEALRIAVAVGEALAAAHAQGLIHRDVKPDNILLTPKGEVKLADMGLAKDTSGEDLNLTKTGRGLGTPHFMAPEQFKEAKTVDVRCDVYSLGATLYTMVTGNLPFQASNPLDAFIKKSQNEYVPPEQTVPGLSPKLVKAIKQSMEAAPKRRPQSMPEFVALLRSALGAKSGQTWYVIFNDAAGERKKVKGEQGMVAALIRSGKITSDALASRDKNGEFLPIYNFPEFTALFEPSAPSTPVTPPLDGAPPSAPQLESPVAESESLTLQDSEPGSESADGSRFESLDEEGLGVRRRPLAPTKRIGARAADIRAAHSEAIQEAERPVWAYSPIVYIAAGVVVTLLVVGAFIAGRMLR